MKNQVLLDCRWLFFAIFLLQGSGRASTIFWDSAFNDRLFDSQGNSLDDSFSFELGSFGGFVPTFENMHQWAANWKVFDRAFAPDAEGWNSVDQFFTGTVVHDSLGHSSSPDAIPTDVFAQGETAYLWVFNSKAIQPSSEWALLLDASSAGNLANIWAFPDPADPPGTSYTWQLADADTAIIGGVHNVQGAGGYSANPGLFSLQTAVVPEPGTALLVALSGLVFIMRRSARKSPRPKLNPSAAGQAL